MIDGGRGAGLSLRAVGSMSRVAATSSAMPEPSRLVGSSPRRGAAGDESFESGSGTGLSGGLAMGREPGLRGAGLAGAGRALGGAIRGGGAGVASSSSPLSSRGRSATAAGGGGREDTGRRGGAPPGCGGRGLFAGASPRSRKTRSPARAERGPSFALGSAAGSMVFIRVSIAEASDSLPSALNRVHSVWSCSSASSLRLSFESWSASIKRMSSCPGHRSANSLSARNASSRFPDFCIRSAYSRKFCFASVVNPLWALIFPRV